MLLLLLTYHSGSGVLSVTLMNVLLSNMLSRVFPDGKDHFLCIEYNCLGSLSRLKFTPKMDLNVFYTQKHTIYLTSRVLMDVSLLWILLRTGDVTLQACDIITQAVYQGSKSHQKWTSMCFTHKTTLSFRHRVFNGRFIIAKIVGSGRSHSSGVWYHAMKIKDSLK